MKNPTKHLNSIAVAAATHALERAAAEAIRPEPNKELALSIARICHEVNAAYCASLGDYSQAITWEGAPEWQQDSALAGVLMHMANPTATAADSHASWMKQKVDDGWVYGETKDAEKKTHPCIVPYDELPQAQRSKDYIFRGIVHAIIREQCRPSA
jgi:hypothetical protein